MNASEAKKIVNNPKISEGIEYCGCAEHQEYREAKAFLEAFALAERLAPFARMVTNDSLLCDCLEQEVTPPCIHNLAKEALAAFEKAKGK